MDIYWITLAIGLIGLVAGGVLGRWSARRLPGEVRSLVADLRTEIRSLQVALATTTRQKNEYISVVRTVQEERNKWMNLYYDQAAGHDAAQAWATRELNRLTSLFTRVTGKAPPVDKSGQALREVFVATHGGAVAEFREDPQLTRRHARIAEQDAARTEGIEKTPQG